MKGSRIGLHVAALLLPAAVVGATVKFGWALSSGPQILVATFGAQLVALAVWPLLRTGMKSLRKVLLAAGLIAVSTHCLLGVVITLADQPNGMGDVLLRLLAYSFVSLVYGGLISVPTALSVAFLVAHTRDGELSHVAA